MNYCFSFWLPLSSITAKPSADLSRLTIRVATLQDISSLAEVLTQSFHPPFGWFAWTYPFLRLGIYEDLRNRLRARTPHSICLVAVAPTLEEMEADEAIAGTVEMSLHSSPWQFTRSQYLYISNLAVSPGYRRQGIARKLLLRCEKVALEWGFSDIYLHVLEDNHSAYALYLERGYEVKRIEPSFSARMLNRPRKVFLHKHLDSPLDPPNFLESRFRNLR